MPPGECSGRTRDIFKITKPKLNAARNSLIGLNFSYSAFLRPLSVFMRLITVQAIVLCFLLISAVYWCLIPTVIINLPDNIPAFFLIKSEKVNTWRQKLRQPKYWQSEVRKREITYSYRYSVYLVFHLVFHLIFHLILSEESFWW